MSSQLNTLTLSAMRDGLRAKQFSAVELTQAHVAAMERHKALNAFITPTPEQALDMAKASDARLARGEAGLIEGIPVGVKDLFCTTGVLTTAASHILDGFKPQYESTVSARCWAAGGVMMGKTNLDEFAMGSANITSFYGPVVSPWRRQMTDDGGQKAGSTALSAIHHPSSALVPGGSSGGSAVAVAAGMCPVALGTDTGGSIRQPAAFCGIVGIKPTYGRVSRYGTIAFASSLDQAGPMTRSVRDAAIMLNVLCGHDPKDSTSAPLHAPDFEAAVARGVKGLRIGIPKEYRPDGLNTEIAALWDKGAQWLREAGAEIVDITLPHTQYALATYYVVAPAECSSNLARYDGVRFGLREKPEAALAEMYEASRAAGFGAEVKRRILIGTYVLSAGYYDAYYKKAQSVRALIARDFAQAFDTVDAILTPTAPSAAFALGEKQDDPITMYLNDVFTVPASLAGLPAISVPAGLNSEGLPLGLQLIGKAFDEETVLAAANVLEAASGFSAKPI